MDTSPGGLAALLVLLPASVERTQYLGVNGAAGDRNLVQFAREQDNVDAVIASLRQKGGRAPMPGYTPIGGRCSRPGGR